MVAAIAHPVRLHVLAELGDQSATPREVAERLGEPLNNVCYHIDVLRRLECIELVSVGAAAGGRVAERRYRAIRSTVVDNDGWEQLGYGEKLGIVADILRMLGQDLEDAIQAGTIMDPDNPHTSRTPMTVDEQGWAEVADLLDTNLQPLQEIKKRVAERQRRQRTATFPIKVGILQFRSPD